MRHKEKRRIKGHFQLAGFGKLGVEVVRFGMTLAWSLHGPLPSEGEQDGIVWRRAYQLIVVEFRIKSSVQLRPVGHFSQWFGTRWLRLILGLVMGAGIGWSIGKKWKSRKGKNMRLKMLLYVGWSKWMILDLSFGTWWCSLYWSLFLLKMPLCYWVQACIAHHTTSQ